MIGELVSDDQTGLDGGCGWQDDSSDENVVDSSYTEHQVAIGNNTEQVLLFHDDLSGINHPLSSSTPPPSLHELQGSPHMNMFVKSLTPLPVGDTADSLTPAIKSIPLLRPIRTQNLSAPNLFASYPPPAAAMHDSTLNNTLPRVGRLPPLRRKYTGNLTGNSSPRHLRSRSDGRISSPSCDHHRRLSHSTSAGEYEPISEGSYEPYL